ncbi:hypothetical protein [Streptomyces cadmiisoli]|uniref:hypothetical protein n=1 Tax=Streptomyces cadmiisoli TaxID=2184053 RepID=UPI00365E2F33
MWDAIFVGLFVSIAAELLRRVRDQWRIRRTSRTVEALGRGETVRIRCAARFRSSGGARRRAYLTVGAEGAFISTSDGSVSKAQLDAPGVNPQSTPTLSMIVCTVAGRKLEVLLPSGQRALFEAVAARLSARRPAPASSVQTPSPDPEPDRPDKL